MNVVVYEYDPMTGSYSPEWREVEMSQTSGIMPAMTDNVKKTIVTKPPRKPKK